MQKQKVLIIGNYGAGNLGDEAILEGMLALFPRTKFFPIVVSANPAETRKKYGVMSVLPYPAGFKSLWRGINIETEKAFAQADFAVLGGGGLFGDHHKLASLIWFLQASAVMKNKKKLFCIGQSISPLKTFYSRFFAKTVMNYAEQIIVRDMASVNVLQDLEIEKSKIKVGCDLAEFGKSFKAKKIKNSMAVSLRAWKNTENLQEILTKVLPQIAQKVFLIPMGDDDAQVLQCLKNSLCMPKNSVELCKVKTPEEVKKVLAKCELTLGMRLHANILSSVVGTKFVALSYDKKVSAFANEVGAQSLDLAEISEKSLLEKIKKTKLDAKKIAARKNKMQEFLKKLFA